jgi:succinate-semialdehyde dehydrogenase/glutarate-semialdehyde dehydrogenase
MLVDAPTDLFLGGKWVPASSGGRFDVHDPSTGT